MLAEKQLGRYLPASSGTYKDAPDDFLTAKKPRLKKRTYDDYKRRLARHSFKEDKLSAITLAGHRQEARQAPAGRTLPRARVPQHLLPLGLPPRPARRSTFDWRLELAALRQELAQLSKKQCQH